MVDLLKQLPPLTWRGRQYPVSQRSVNFAHETATHKLQRRNQDLVEQMGAHNLVFSYTIPMREEFFARLGYESLFVEGLPKLFADFRNRKPGELQDPIYGVYQVVPSSYGDDSDPIKRDGTDLKLEFTHSPEDEDDEFDDTPTIAAVSREREELEVGLVEIEDEETRQSLELSLNELLDSAGDIIETINGAGQQVLNTTNRVDASLERISFRAKKLEDTARTLATPEAWAIQADSRSLRDRAERAKSRRRNQGTNVRTTNSPQSLTSLAAEYGVSVADLVSANPSLGRSPTVPAGSVVVLPS